MARSADLVRPWRGVAPEERVAGRREQLLEAALEVFAADTYQRSKVRDVCRAAGLTERYFYESFTGKEDLLRALALRICQDFLEAAAPSLALADRDLDATIDGGVAAAVHSMTDDPRRARILFVEIVGVSPALEDERREMIGWLVQVCRTALEAAGVGPPGARIEVELTGRAVLGAAIEILVAYVRGELKIDQQELIVHLQGLMRRGRNAVHVLPTSD